MKNNSHIVSDAKRLSLVIRPNTLALEKIKGSTNNHSQA